MSQANRQAWLALRAETLERLGRLWKTSLRIRTGLHDVPLLLSLLDEFSAEAAMLEEHETVVEQWSLAGLVRPEPLVEALVARRWRRLAGFQKRVEAALDERLESLPRDIPSVVLQADGSFVLRKKAVGLNHEQR